MGGRRRRRRVGVRAGNAGAALGTVLYELVGAAAFPLDRTVQPLALSWGARLLARLSVATCAAVGAALAVEDPRNRFSTAVDQS